MSTALTCAWQHVLHAPVHFVICLLEGEHNVDPVERLQKLPVFGAGLWNKVRFEFCKLQWMFWFSQRKQTWSSHLTQTVKSASSVLTLVRRIGAVGMTRVTNWLVSSTVKLSVCRTDTFPTVSLPLSWLPRLVKPMCRFKMCSSVSSSLT